MVFRSLKQAIDVMRGADSKIMTVAEMFCACCWIDMVGQVRQIHHSEVCCLGQTKNHGFPCEHVLVLLESSTQILGCICSILSITDFLLLFVPLPSPYVHLMLWELQDPLKCICPFLCLGMETSKFGHLMVCVREQFLQNLKV